MTSSGKSFFTLRERVMSADKKPENYKDPRTGKTKVRMVPVDKEIIKTESAKHIDEASYNKNSKAHQHVRKTARGFKGFTKAEYHPDGSATVHTGGMPKHGVSSATAADHILKRSGGVHNNSEKSLANHKQKIGGLKFHVKKSNQGHSVHIKEDVEHENCGTPDCCMTCDVSEASPMIADPSKTTFSDKKSALAYKAKNGGKVMQHVFTNPRTGKSTTTFKVVKEDTNEGYKTSSEKSQFGGHRAHLKNPQGKTAYLGSTSYKKPEHAKGEAQAYHDAYFNSPVKANDRGANRAVTLYRVKNKHNMHVKEDNQLDPVKKDELKKKFHDRKDKDINNDGKVDSTDKYLHKRRQAISKNIPAMKSEVMNKEMYEKEFVPHMMYDPKTGKSYKADKPEDHERMNKMGYIHKMPKKEYKEGIEESYVHVRMDHLTKADHKKVVGVLKGHEKSGHISYDSSTDKGAVFKLHNKNAHSKINTDLKKHYTSADITEAVSVDGQYAGMRKLAKRVKDRQAQGKSVKLEPMKANMSKRFKDVVAAATARNKEREKGNYKESVDESSDMDWYSDKDKTYKNGKMVLKPGAKRLSKPTKRDTNDTWDRNRNFGPTKAKVKEDVETVDETSDELRSRYRDKAKQNLKDNPPVDKKSTKKYWKRQDSMTMSRNAPHKYKAIDREARANLKAYGEGVEEAAKKGLYYNVNKRKKAGTSRPASSSKAPTDQAWRDAAKTAKKESVAENNTRNLSKVSTERLQAHWNKHKDEPGAGAVFAQQLRAVARELARRKKSEATGEGVEEATKDPRLASKLAARKAQRAKNAARAASVAQKKKEKAAKPAAAPRKARQVKSDIRDSSERNIIMQLRKAQDVGGRHEIEFRRDKGKLTKPQIDALLKAHDKLQKPDDKRRFRIAVIQNSSAAGKLANTLIRGS